jgi:hypothetical protein
MGGVAASSGVFSGEAGRLIKIAEATSKNVTNALRSIVLSDE